MRRFIERLKLIFQLAKMWNQALDFTAESDFHAALRIVREMEALGASRSELTLLKGFLLFAVAENESALETLIEAYERISRDTAISHPNKEYLMCYASVCGRNAMKALGRKVETPFNISIWDVRLEQVQGHYKQKFPLPDHPDWSE